MHLLHNTFKASVKDRKILTFLMMTFVLTSSHVTTVRAAGPSADVSGVAQQTGLPVAVDEPLPANDRPSSGEPAINVLRTVRTTMTAYSSNSWQTDGTPFVTADGSCVGDGIVAANFLRIGTKVRFPDLFGDKVFEVRDRMNERYANRIDVWMKDVQRAKSFGVKRNVAVEVVEEGDGKKNWDLGLTDRACKQQLLAQL